MGTGDEQKRQERVRTTKEIEKKLRKKKNRGSGSKKTKINLWLMCFEKPRIRRRFIKIKK